MRRLPTQSRLCKLKMLSASQCYFCWNDRETLDHLFVNCPFSKSIWAKLLRTIHPHRKRARNYAVECQWILSCFKANQLAGNIAKLVFDASLYHIWYERNQRHFQSVSRLKDKTIDDMLFEVGVKVKGLKNSCREDLLTQHFKDRWGLGDAIGAKAPVMFTWPRPKCEIWVLSCDGSVKSARAGYGELLRDNYGTAILGYAGTTMNLNVLWVELYALYRGLVAARDRDIINIILYMDLKLGVEIMKGAASCPGRVLSLKSKIDGLISGFGELHFQHVWRKANQTADILAN